MLTRSKRKTVLEWFNSMSCEGPLESLSQLGDGIYFYKACRVFNSSSENEVESISTENRYDFVKNCLNEFYRTYLDMYVDCTECMNGNELELAKLAIILLTALVYHSLPSQDSMLNNLTHLEPQIQEEIQDCIMSVVLNDGDEIKLSPDFYKVLTSHSVSPSPYATPRRRSIRAGSRKKILQQPCEITPTFSPLKMMIDSPQFLYQVAMFKKEMDMKHLREQLNSEENKSSDLRNGNQSLKDVLTTKDKEISELKEKIEEYRKFRDAADDMSICNSSLEESNAKLLSLQQKYADYPELKSRVQQLEQECEALINTNRLEEQKVAKCAELKSTNQELKLKIESLSLCLEEQQRNYENLQQEFINLNDALKNSEQAVKISEEKYNDVKNELRRLQASPEMPKSPMPMLSNLKIEEMEITIQHRNINLAKLNNEANELKKEIKELNAQIQVQSKRHNKKMDSMLSKVSHVKNERVACEQQLLTQVQQLSKDLNECELEKKQLIDAKESYEAQTLARDAHEQNLQAKINILSDLLKESELEKGNYLAQMVDKTNCEQSLLAQIDLLKEDQQKEKLNSDKESCDKINELKNEISQIKLIEHEITKQQIEKNMSDNAELKCIIAKYSNDLTEHEQKNFTLKESYEAEMKKLNEEMFTIKTALQKAMQQNEVLTNENCEVNKTVTELQFKIEQLGQNLDSNELLKQELIREKENYLNQVNYLNDKAIGQVKDIQDLNSQNEVCKGELCALRNINEELAQNMKNKEIELQDIIKSNSITVENLKKDLSAISEQLQNTSRDYELYKSKYFSLKEETEKSVQEKIEEIARKDFEILTLKPNIDELNRRVQVVEQDLENEQREVQQLLQNSERLENLIADREKRITEVEIDKKKLSLALQKDKKKDTHSEEIINLEKTNQELLNTIQIKDELLKKLEAKVKLDEKENEEMVKYEQENFNEKIETLKMEKEQLNSQILELTNKSANQHCSFDQLVNEHQNLRRFCEEMELNTQKQKEELETVIADNKEKLKVLEIINSEKHALEVLQSQTKNEAENHHSMYKSLQENHLEHLKNCESQMRIHDSEKQSLLETLENDNESLRERIDDLERNLQSVKESKVLSENEYYMCLEQKEKKMEELKRQINEIEGKTKIKIEPNDKGEQVTGVVNKLHSDSSGTEKKIVTKVEMNRKQFITDGQTDGMTVEEQLKFLQMENKKLNGKCQIKQKALDQFSAEMKQTSELVATSKDNFEKKLKMQAEERDSICLKYTHLKKLTEKLQTEKSEKDKQLKKYVEAVHNFQNKAVFKSSQENNLRESLGKSKHAQQCLKAELEETRLSLVPLQNKIQKLENDLQDQQKHNNSLEVQLQHASRQLAQLKRSADEKSAGKNIRSSASYPNIKSSVSSRKCDPLPDGKQKVLKELPTFIGHSTSTKSIDSIGTNKLEECNMSFNASAVSSGFNKSLRGTGSRFLPQDDEEEFLNHSSIASLRPSLAAPSSSRRINELQRRNTLCPPHMRSSYPVETQMHPTSRFSDEALKEGHAVEENKSFLHVGPKAKTKSVSPKRKRVNSVDSVSGAAKKQIKKSDSLVKNTALAAVKTNGNLLQLPCSSPAPSNRSLFSFKTPTSIKRLIAAKKKMEKTSKDKKDGLKGLKLTYKF